MGTIINSHKVPGPSGLLLTIVLVGGEIICQPDMDEFIKGLTKVRDDLAPFHPAMVKDVATLVKDHLTAKQTTDEPVDPPAVRQV